VGQVAITAQNLSRLIIASSAPFRATAVIEYGSLPNAAGNPTKEPDLSAKTHPILRCEGKKESDFTCEDRVDTSTGFAIAEENLIFRANDFNRSLFKCCNQVRAGFALIQRPVNCDFTEVLFCKHSPPCPDTGAFPVPIGRAEPKSQSMRALPRSPEF
jgi:hypothetical protein